MSRGLNSICEQALYQGIAGSISVYVGLESLGSQAHISHHGRTNEACHTASDQNSVYDLASLTKVIGTALAVAKAINAGYISLSEQPFNAWPGVSVRNLLAHTSGLAAHIKFYAEPGVSFSNFSPNQSLIFSSLFRQKPQGLTGTRLYSDLNFLALGWLLEQRLRKPLIDIFRETWDHLNIPVQFAFFPSGYIDAATRAEVAPTGFCELRQTVVRAQVNDLNCYVLGGVAGHAGLFGTLSSVAAIANFLLGCVKRPRNSLEELIAYFASTGLAFAKPEAQGSVRMLSPKSFGHFGFTGTSLWIDPMLSDGGGLVIALLSNRVHFSLRPQGIFWLRERIHEMASKGQLRSL